MKKLSVILLALIFILSGCGKAEPKEVIGSFSFLVRCDNILKNTDKLNKDKSEFVPENGYLIEKTVIDLHEGDTPFDVLTTLCREKGIKVEFASTAGTDTKYVNAINNLYPGDCGEMSGWVYTVNGEYSNEAANVYQIKDNDLIEWIYTCDLGRDIGGDYAQRNGKENE